MMSDPWVLAILAAVFLVLIKLRQVSKRFPGLLSGRANKDETRDK